MNNCLYCSETIENNARYCPYCYHSIGENITILVVDDIYEVREKLISILQAEKEFIVVGEAENGIEAIAAFNRIMPEVIIMNICMPYIDGIAVTETIKKESPRTKIIIHSVLNEPDYMRRAMLAGARDFLPKMGNSDELVSTIRKVGREFHTQGGLLSQKEGTETAELPKKAIIKELLLHIEKTNTKLQLEAIRKVGNLHLKRAINQLQKVIEDTKCDYRLDAITSLGKIHDPLSYKVLFDIHKSILIQESSGTIDKNSLYIKWYTFDALLGLNPRKYFDLMLETSSLNEGLINNLPYNIFKRCGINKYETINNLLFNKNRICSA